MVGTSKQSVPERAIDRWWNRELKIPNFPGKWHPRVVQCSWFHYFYLLLMWLPKNVWKMAKTCIGNIYDSQIRRWESLVKPPEPLGRWYCFLIGMGWFCQQGQTIDPSMAISISKESPCVNVYVVLLYMYYIPNRKIVGQTVDLVNWTCHVYLSHMILSAEGRKAISTISSNCVSQL